MYHYVITLYIVKQNNNPIRQQRANSKKTETMMNTKEEQTQKLAVQIQEMQSAMQKAAVEAAKAAVQQAA